MLILLLIIFLLQNKVCFFVSHLMKNYAVTDAVLTALLKQLIYFSLNIFPCTVISLILHMRKLSHSDWFVVTGAEAGFEPRKSHSRNY